MNRNIEVINENLYAVNMQYVKAGYIAEMKIIPNTKGGQINLSNTGKIILDKGAVGYPALKKLFLNCMKKTNEELIKIMTIPAEDSVDDLCKNVVGWELKRRSIEAEYEASKPNLTYRDRFIKWIRKKVNIWHQSKRE